MLYREILDVGSAIHWTRTHTHTYTTHTPHTARTHTPHTHSTHTHHTQHAHTHKFCRQNVEFCLLTWWYKQQQQQPQRNRTLCDCPCNVQTAQHHGTAVAVTRPTAPHFLVQWKWRVPSRTEQAHAVSNSRDQWTVLAQHHCNKTFLTSTADVDTWTAAWNGDTGQTLHLRRGSKPSLQTVIKEWRLSTPRLLSNKNCAF
jgi:hypothetical protein